jgi:hypothetical protein
VPVRQWVLSLPSPLRLLLAAQPQLVTLVLQVVHREMMRRSNGHMRAVSARSSGCAASSAEIARTS